MKFKEVEIIKDPSFGSIKFIANYNKYHNADMLEKFATCMPRKGDVICIIDKNTHQRVFLQVRYVAIDYDKDTMTIWCK